MPKYFRRGSALTNSSFHRGRAAGAGTLYDDYGDESGRCLVPFDKEYVHVRLPHDKDRPESLNGPVIIVKPGKKADSVESKALDK